jgi:uncharacterized protein (TIGR03032 family)
VRLHAALVRLPLRYDAEALATEVAAVSESAWRAHPEGHPGNSALPLVSLHGDPDDDGVRGPMRPTPILASLPTIRGVLASIGAPIGRSRLMRLDGDAEATAHVDVNYYWLRHARVHVPVVTNPGVRFVVGDAETNMAPGETWVFDTWRRHNVLNPAESRRIHLVIDTVGSASFWDLVDNGEIADDGPLVPSAAPLVSVEAGASFDLETINHPIVMPPSELEELLDWLASEAPDDPTLATAWRDLRHDWRATWSIYGADPVGHERFRGLIERATTAIEPLRTTLRLPNGSGVVAAFHHAVAAVAVAAAPATPAQSAVAMSPRRIHRPVFVVCPPRSGSSLLFETLARSPDLWTPGGESHRIIEGISALHPANRDWESNRLTAADAKPDVIDELVGRFEASLRDRRGNRPPDHLNGLIMLEKTPKNALRVPFLAAAFPDARFVYLYRDPIDSMASMLEGWRSGRFVTYSDLPDWPDPRWSFLLVPGWRDLAHLPLREVVARQWATTTSILLDDLAALDPERWCVSGYGPLVTNPQAEITRLCRFLGARWDQRLDGPLPNSAHTVTPPDPAKTARNARELADVVDLVGDVSERARTLFANPPGRRRHAAPRRRTQLRVQRAPNGPGFESGHTRSINDLLAKAKSSLAVSTYQSGQVILIRPREETVNTHFRPLESPMGMATAGQQLVVGTRSSVVTYVNHATAAPAIEPAGAHDAAYLPRSVHYTGNVRVHDVGIAGDGAVWIVNTSFSCLATLDDRYSFMPRWKPPFTTDLAAEDRCHLNGMAMVDGAPKYVTALGTSDERGGWRQAKGFGGVIMDVTTNDVVAANLCMPHSPRWHGGRLWVLESGKGALSTVDVNTGELTTVAELPGFTRGLAFIGRYAIVGLSLVRESLFDGVPIVGRSDLACGVWVIDTTDGAVVGMLRFSGRVQELFDVQVLPYRNPELVASSDAAVATSFAVPAGAVRRAAEASEPSVFGAQYLEPAAAPREGSRT